MDFRWYRCRRDPEQILGVFFDLFGIYIEKYIHCFSQVIWKKVICLSLLASDER